MYTVGHRSSLHSSTVGIGYGAVYHRISILSQVTSVSKVDPTAKTNSCHSDHAHTRLDTALVYNSRRRPWCSSLDLICLPSSNKYSVRRRQTAAIVIMVEQSNSSRRLWRLTPVSRSVSSREVRLHDQESLTELCRVNPGCT